MTYRLAICDDEELILAVLQKQIQEISQEEHIEVLVESYQNPMKLIEKINEDSTWYDLIFLDIDMPEMNGIEAGKKIKEINEEIIITFVTAYGQYALKAFEVHAFQYVMKPIKKNQLREVLLKSFRLLLKIKRDEQRFITIQDKDQYIKIPYKDIVYFEKYKNRIHIVCEKGEYTYYLTFQKLKQMLKGGVFIPCHRSIMVHKEKITGFKNNKIITLNDERSLPVSKPYINDIKEIFLDLLRENPLL